MLTILYDGNPKNSKSSNYYFYEFKSKKKLDYDKSFISPEKTTANFLGKGNDETDIMDGNRKRKVPYRDVQAKDAINYTINSWIENNESIKILI